MKLHCDMERECTATVTHIDRKGYVYCTAHGHQRQIAQACRKLTAAELKRLENNETIKY